MEKACTQRGKAISQNGALAVDVESKTVSIEPVKGDDIAEITEKTKHVNITDLNGINVRPCLRTEKFFNGDDQEFKESSCESIVDDEAKSEELVAKVEDPCDRTDHCSLETEQNTSSSSESASARRFIEYVAYESELQMPAIMALITKDLSEPYSIYTYRYFIHSWPQLCFLVSINRDVLFMLFLVVLLQLCIVSYSAKVWFIHNEHRKLSSGFV